MIEDKILEKIDEVKYLAQENTPYYRSIMRTFYNKYEQAEYWLYKEDVFDCLKDVFANYSLEDVERNLEFLVENGSLTRLQDTQNINTVNEWKFRNYRYQMTDKAVIIERMTIELEELEVKVTNLEPRLFERINQLIGKFVDIDSLNEDKVYEVWTDLLNDFKNLNEQYQDFLKKFHEAKTEELLQSEVFLEFKSSMINYINNFISSYIKSSTAIRENLLKIDNDKVNKMMDKLIHYQQNAPKMIADFDFDKLRMVNLGKWHSIYKWFIGINTLSEGERLLEATQKIISKIYKYASSLLELHGNMINRKEDYIHICHLFDQMKNIEDADKLALSIFGVIRCRHFRGSSMLNTDSLIPTYDVKTLEIPIESKVKEYKINNTTNPIIDRSKEKAKILNSVIEEAKVKKEKIKKLISGGVINLEGRIELGVFERRYILKLIQKYQNKKTKESEYGYLYEIIQKDGTCTIHSEDGDFLMNARIIRIEGENIV